ncbi:MAG: tyrosine--tRNA ligase [Planctomycetia bacterium]|nr:tyrosine--tRNA ligase [Planctomycetia bacterium]
MSTVTMDVIAELRWRNQIHQTTDDENIAAWLLEKPRTIYAGFDPTADSLHVGHLMALMMLRRFQKAGHKVIALVGGATGMIGDPSGKSEERKQLSEDVLRHNVASLKVQLEKFLDFSDTPHGAIMVNNYDWFRNLTFLDFLRDVGKFFPVNMMLAKDSVKARLERENGLSYTEFSYMLLQAYDFVTLYRKYGCQLQVGGSDQWGNITAGIDLTRRMEGGVQMYGVTAPLLTKSDGQKMGKSESGALWLDPKRVSPYLFYQYWMNLEDSDVHKLLCFATDLPKDEVDSIMKKQDAEPAKREGQRRVAEEITRLVHGTEGLLAAQQATEIFFGAEIRDLDDAQLSSIFSDVPSAEFTRQQLAEGIPLAQAFCAAGLASSKSEVRRGIQQGGIYVNNCRISELEMNLTEKQLASETSIVIRMGRKKYAVIKII